MAETKPTVTLKDGTVITLDDASQIAQYSNRQDLDSITFGGDDTASKPLSTPMPAPPLPAALINASLTIDTDPKETKAVVEQPKNDPVVPKPPPAGDASTTITLTIGALSGAVSSAGMPALSNFIKNFLKNKLKGKKGGESKEEEAEEPTDCKTHQLKSNAKMVKMAARIAALENRPTNYKEQESSFGADSLSDLEERIEKLEKKLKDNKRGKK